MIGNEFSFGVQKVFYIQILEDNHEKLFISALKQILNFVLKNIGCHLGKK